MTLQELIAQWRQKAITSREEATRIRLTIKEPTGAEERCNVRAEVWDQVADALEGVLSTPPQERDTVRECNQRAMESLRLWASGGCATLRLSRDDAHQLLQDIAELAQVREERDALRAHHRLCQCELTSKEGYDAPNGLDCTFRLSAVELKAEVTRLSAALAVPSESPIKLRNLDTPENREFWASVDRAVVEWEASRPAWSRELGPKLAPMPTAVDLFRVALEGADSALPVLITMLTKVGLKQGVVVADEIHGNIKCALKVYAATLAQQAQRVDELEEDIRRRSKLYNELDEQCTQQAQELQAFKAAHHDCVRVHDEIEARRDGIEGENAQLRASLAALLPSRTAVQAAIGEAAAYSEGHEHSDVFSRIKALLEPVDDALRSSVSKHG